LGYSANIIVRSAGMPDLYGLPSEFENGAIDLYQRFVHPDDRHMLDEANRQAFASGDLVASEYRIIRPDGEVRWLREQGEAFRNDEGRIVRIIGVTEDVTARKHTEEALAAERDVLTTLMNNIPDAVYVKDNQSRFLRSTRREPGHRSLRSRRRARQDRLRLLPEGARERLLRRRTARDRDRRTDPQQAGGAGSGSGCGPVVADQHRPLRDRDGVVIGLVGSARDVTELHRLEEELRRGERGRRGGQPSQERVSDHHESRASDADERDHRLRPPAARRARWPLVSEQHGDVNRIATAADRLMTLINNVLDLARIESGRFTILPERVRLDDVVAQVRLDLAPQIVDRGIDLVVDLQPALPPIAADPQRLRRSCSTLSATR
jgi:PAS domain-containing protein